MTLIAQTVHNTAVEVGQEKPRLCLNMLVKGEAANIERCLASVAPFIAAWVIGEPCRFVRGLLLVDFHRLDALNVPAPYADTEITNAAWVLL